MRHHRLSADELAELASGAGGAPVIHKLRTAQVSRRMLMLHAIRDLVGDGPAAEHFELLATVSRSAPQAVRQVLGLPYAGAWITSTLRALRAPAGSGPADLGYLGGLAAVAADRAGLDFQITVVTTTGDVMLPGSGLVRCGTVGAVPVARVAGRWRVGRIRLPDRATGDGAGWWEVRTLRAECDGLRLAVQLDDIDPFRDCHDRSVADRLGADEVAGWQQLLSEAWPVLVRHHRPYAEGIAAGLVSIVPLWNPSIRSGMNSTSLNAFGAIGLTPPADAAKLAEGILHEFQHAKLGAVLDLVPLYQDEGAARFYAPWRDDPRPLSGALQGAYAFAGVTEFLRAQRRALSGPAALVAEAEFARRRQDVWQVTGDLIASGALTNTGKNFLGRLRSRQREWWDEPVSADAAAAARAATDDHWAGWRLRNRCPDPAVVATLAGDFVADRPCPAGPVPVTLVRGQSRLLAYSPRVDLARLRRRDPVRFAAYAGDGPAVAAAVPGACLADVSLVAGDYAAARAGYRWQIGSGGGSIDSWIGLTLACQRDPAVDRGLLRSPELCLAVHDRVRTGHGDLVDPLSLAEWLLPATDQEMAAAHPA